jgi:hypothetical protein
LKESTVKKLKTMFSISTKYLNDNKQQLIQGFDLLNSKSSIVQYLEDENIIKIFEYCYQFTQSNFGGPNVLEICDFFIENGFHVNLFKLTEYLTSICERIEDNLTEYFYFYM